MPLGIVDVVLVVLGMLGLAAHCGSMFYRSSVQTLPGAARAVAEIDALGTASIIAFAVPAGLLLLGLRRIYLPALALVALALAAVGTTMYDNGPLTAHRTAIFVTVTLLTLCAATLIEGPHNRRRIAASAS
ncbi:MAG: hypothetical protein J0H43_02915 [Actinobacteria bacterium]|nr:hypothetical protein [Actinomycetota bacterium]